MVWRTHTPLSTISFILPNNRLPPPPFGVGASRLGNPGSATDQGQRLTDTNTMFNLCICVCITVDTMLNSELNVKVTQMQRTHKRYVWTGHKRRQSEIPIHKLNRFFKVSFDRHQNHLAAAISILHPTIFIRSDKSDLLQSRKITFYVALKATLFCVRRVLM